MASKVSHGLASHPSNVITSPPTLWLSPYQPQRSFPSLSVRLSFHARASDLPTADCSATVRTLHKRLLRECLPAHLLWDSPFSSPVPFLCHFASFLTTLPLLKMSMFAPFRFSLRNVISTRARTLSAVFVSEPTVLGKVAQWAFAGSVRVTPSLLSSVSSSSSGSAVCSIAKAVASCDTFNRWLDNCQHYQFHTCFPIFYWCS